MIIQTQNEHYCPDEKVKKKNTLNLIKRFIEKTHLSFTENIFTEIAILLPILPHVIHYYITIF